MAEFALSFVFVLLIFLLPVVLAAGAFVTLLLTSVMIGPVVRKLPTHPSTGAVPQVPASELPFAGRNGLAVVDYIARN